MERGSMGQMLACGIGGLLVGTALDQFLHIGKVPGIVLGLTLGILVDLYLSFFHKK